MPDLSQKHKVIGLVASVGGLLAIASPFAVAEFERGQALYENHCQECHESWAHTREGHQVTTMADLRGRVTAWAIHSNLQWSAEEIEDVTDYLNRHFYQLTEKP